MRRKGRKLTIDRGARALLQIAMLAAWQTSLKRGTLEVTRECAGRGSSLQRRWQRGQKCVLRCATKTRRTGVPHWMQGAAARP